MNRPLKATQFVGLAGDQEIPGTALVCMFGGDPQTCEITVDEHGILSIIDEDCRLHINPANWREQ